MKTQTMQRLWPRVADAFHLYLSCRSIGFVHMEIKKDRGKKVEHKVLPFVTGFHSLPVAGGMLDQPSWTIEMFGAFKAGENAGVQKAL